MLYIRKIDGKKDDYKSYTHMCGKELLQHALEKEHGIPLSELETATYEKGKPYFKNSAVQFSISHTDGLCAVLLDDIVCGVDCEYIRSESYGVMKRCFTESERAYVENSKERNLSFTMLWTLKECYSKISGEGLSLGFEKYGFDIEKGVCLFECNYDFYVYVADEEYVVTRSHAGKGRIFISNIKCDDNKEVKRL